MELCEAAEKLLGSTVGKKSKGNYTRHYGHVLTWFKDMEIESKALDEDTLVVNYFTTLSYTIRARQFVDLKIRYYLPLKDHRQASEMPSIEIKPDTIW